MEKPTKRTVDWPSLGALATVLAVLLTVTLAQGAGIRADVDNLRMEVRADVDSLRMEVRADVMEVRADVAALREDVANIRDDLHTLSERVARIEGALAGPHRLVTPVPAPATGEGTP